MSRTSQHSILIVEDAETYASVLKGYLEHDPTFRVEVETRGELAAGRILKDRPDLVVLDLVMPGANGLDVLQSVRDEFRGLIMILTGRREDDVQVRGFELGADDFVIKPVSPRVIQARIRALLRRRDREE